MQHYMVFSLPYLSYVIMRVYKNFACFSSLRRSIDHALRRKTCKKNERCAVEPASVVVHGLIYVVPQF